MAKPSIALVWSEEEHAVSLRLQLSQHFASRSAPLRLAVQLEQEDGGSHRPPVV